MLKFEKATTDKEAMAEMAKVLEKRQVVIEERNAKIDEQIAQLEAEKLLN